MSLTLHIEQPFEGIVWKQLLDEHQQLLSLEIRNQETLQTSFVSLDISSGQVFPIIHDLEQPWWTGLEHCGNGHVITHGYEDESRPEHKGVKCYSIVSGELKWQLPEAVFFAHDDTAIYVHGQNNSFEKIDISTGMETAIPGFPEPVCSFKEFIAESPIAYHAQQDHFDTVASYVKELLSIDPIERIEYKEWNGMILVSYYIRGDYKLDNYFLVLDSTGEVIMSDKIASEVEGVGFDTFYTFSDYLILIKEKNQLMILKHEN